MEHDVLYKVQISCPQEVIKILSQRAWWDVWGLTAALISTVFFSLSCACHTIFQAAACHVPTLSLISATTAPTSKIRRHYMQIKVGLIGYMPRLNKKLPLQSASPSASGAAVLCNWQKNFLLPISSFVYHGGVKAGYELMHFGELLLNIYKIFLHGFWRVKCCCGSIDVAQ